MSLRETIKSVLADQFGKPVEEIGDDVNIVDGLGADSLDCVELHMAFEEEFGKPIPDCDADKLFTVEQIEKYARETLGLEDDEKS